MFRVNERRVLFFYRDGKITITMIVQGTLIDDVHAEAFAMVASRLVVTAEDEHWLAAAVACVTGYGTSIIGCDAEVGLEGYVEAEATPDGRVGASILFFARTMRRLGKAVQNRAGQCLMTCPTTAVFDGMPQASERFDLGRWLRFFGDGHQKRTIAHDRKGYHIPVMSGEFFCQDDAGVLPGLGGATLFVAGGQPGQTLHAARQAAEAMGAVPRMITPFPGGVCRCGSKVGSKYASLMASTHHVYCPTLRKAAGVNSKLHEAVTCQYEIVIDGLTVADVTAALGVGIQAAAGSGARVLSAGQYEGKLGDVIEIRFHELMSRHRA